MIVTETGGICATLAEAWRRTSVGPSFSLGTTEL
jgi:hypothetical protein